MNWYIVQAYSGFEKKVVDSIKDELKKNKLQEKLGEILVPTHQVTEVKKGMMGWDMKTGFQTASGKALAVIDGDGQMPSGDVIRVYQLMVKGI